MPKRGQTSKQAIDKLVGIEAANKSQIKSELYEKLKNENRLASFKAYVRKCSTLGYDMKSTVSYIVNKLPGYFDKHELTVGVFKEMLKENDIAFAYGYGEDGNEIMEIMLEDKANEIALRAKDIETLIARNEFINGLNINKSNSLSNGNDSNPTVINFNIVSNNEGDSEDEQ